MAAVVSEDYLEGLMPERAPCFTYHEGQSRVFTCEKGRGCTGDEKKVRAVREVLLLQRLLTPFSPICVLTWAMPTL